MKSEEIKSEKINYKKTFRLLLSMAKPYKTSFAKAFAYLIISTALAMLSPIIIRHIIDYAIASRNYPLLLLEISIYALVTVLFLIVNYAMYVSLIKIGQNITTDLKNKMFAHMLLLDMDYFAKNPVGKLTARIEADTARIYDLFTETALMIVKDIIMFFGVFIIMFYHSPALTLVLLPLFPVIMGITWLFSKKSAPLFVKVRRLTSEISGYLTEMINSIKIVQGFSMEELSARRLNRLNREKFAAEFKAEYLMVLFFMTILLLQPLSTSAVFGFGGFWTLKGKITVGILVMFLMYLDSLFEPVFRFSEHISIVQKSFSAGQRIDMILSLVPGIQDVKKSGLAAKNMARPFPGAQGAAMVTETPTVFPDGVNGLRKGIEFKNVWMKYEENSDWVLKDVSCFIEKGKTFAIVGETGGGKTTLINVLLRFYNYQKGEIFLDDIPLKKISIASLRSLFGLVQQDMYLFPGTILDNLKIMDFSVPDAKIYDAIDKMELNEFFRKHSLKKKIVEKGANISTGEKQIISLLRAMILNQPFLILDEATAYVDPYTERTLTRALKRISEDKTLIVIAHRLSTIEAADRITFISNGRILEEGVHDELLKKGGLYSKYYKIQFGDRQ